MALPQPPSRPAPVPESAPPGVRKLRDTYAITPGAPLVRREFGFYCLERWREQGMPADANHAELFQYDPGGSHGLGQLGWCEAAFAPAFETKIVEDRGDHEVEQDYAGRHVLYFKGRRNGFMPEYMRHPVRDQRSWEEDVLWRLDPTSAGRYADLDARMDRAENAARQGYLVTQGLVGGYMYLRSLIGPADLPMMFYDDPDVVHACMRAWFELAVAVIAKHQERVTLDELFLAEDICYKGGMLLSPAMMAEFLTPYYHQLIDNVRARQLDATRHLYIHIDTDGYVDDVIPIYQELGMDVMSPFEVAAGCDVLRTAAEHPGLVIFGGIDKHVLAGTTEDIDRMVERILPAMRERGGFIPTCDHGVPEEVPYENYLHYRRRCVELGG